MSVHARQAVFPGETGRLRLHSGRWLMVMVALMSIALLYWVIQQLVNPMNVPVSKIQVQGSFVNVKEEMLTPLSKQVTGVGYFDIEVSSIQQQVESLPWIEQATVRRVWPDTLAIHFVERQPLAIWVEGGLLSLQGEIFKPDASTYPSGLPVFDGPHKLSHRMLENYYRFSEALAPLGMRIQELKLNKRQSWQIVLDNGLHLKLGREHEFERLARFIRVYPQLSAMDKGGLESVDLRYTNGMAVSWLENRA